MLFCVHEKKKKCQNHYQQRISQTQNAYQLIHLQTVQNQHKANNQIVHKEIVAISHETTGQSLEISNCFEIVEIEEFGPWS